jgi:arabinofuranan 3-O-arabinosyltransferase
MSEHIASESKTANTSKPTGPWLFVVCLGLALLVIAQQAGKTMADTKFDLVVAPERFLRHAISLWDPLINAGTMQNQSYGYLFPMGPFFVIGKWAHLDPWLVQRLWQVLLVLLAFGGVYRLARLVGVQGFWPQVGAGLCYALAPRMLSELGTISSEVLPVSMLPWILIPLVLGSRGGSERKAAAWSAVALLCAGGVNATATLAILPVPLMWLLTRTSGARRRRLVGWWSACCALACLWWLIPLLLLGKYSPPFLDWIESSQVTTRNTTLIGAMRGADHWIGYLGASLWPGAWILTVAPIVIIATTVVAVGGLSGLFYVRREAQLFLVCTLLLGVVLLTVGHPSALEPAYAHAARGLLDTSLSPLRNVHKFDPVIRLPLSIGLGFCLAAVAGRIDRLETYRLFGRRLPTGSKAIVIGIIASLALIAATPLLTDRIPSRSRTVTAPDWWAQTASWLKRNGGDQSRTLIVPAASRAAYIWGTPGDDAIQPFASSPWTVRDSVPLTNAGYIRFLDLIESRLATGRADPLLADLLATAGIRYVVVRNDLLLAQNGVTPQRFAHATLRASHGFAEVADFGAEGAFDGQSRLDYGLSPADTAVVVYENMHSQGLVDVSGLASVVGANGSADNLPALLAESDQPLAPAVFGTAGESLSGQYSGGNMTMTDGVRRRSFGFGDINTFSGTLSKSEPFANPRGQQDYLPTDAGDLSYFDYEGIASVRASSAGADVNAFLNKSPAFSAWAAIDGDPRTSWRSGSASGAVGQWLEVRYSTSQAATSASLGFASGLRDYPARIEVRTDHGRLVQNVSPDGRAQQISIPPGRFSTLRITIKAMRSGGRGDDVGIAGLDVSGVSPTRTLVVRSSMADPTRIVFQAAAGLREDCLASAAGPVCQSQLARQGEEDFQLARSFSLGKAAKSHVNASVRLLGGSWLNSRLDGTNPTQVSASSMISESPLARAAAVLDHEDSTGWIAAASDTFPVLTFSFGSTARISSIRLTPLSKQVAAPPTRVRIGAGDRSFLLDVPSSGQLRLPTEVATRELTIAVERTATSEAVVPGGARPTELSAGIAEVEFGGSAAPVRGPANSVKISCQDGVGFELNGTTVLLQGTVSTAALLTGAEVGLTACAVGTVKLVAGDNTIRTMASDKVSFRQISLTADGHRVGLPAQGVPPRIIKWTPTRRSVAVIASAASVLIVCENQNAGWEARLRGAELTPIVIDGWEQGWILPAGSSGTVELVYVPQGRFVTGLWVSASAILALMLLLVWPATRRLEQDRASPLVSVTPPRWVLAGTLIVAGYALGGLAGTVLTATFVLGSMLLDRADRFARRAAQPMIVAAVAFAGLLEASHPAGTDHPWANTWVAQLLCVSALALLYFFLANCATKPRLKRLLEQIPRRRREGD